MTEAPRYPKRLIEVDLPIKRISEHARREKSIRHGHISTLHIWWARRPLASCRAVVLAALWPDPADPLCPDRFRKEAADRMREFRDKRGGKQRKWNDSQELRGALLDFIADFSNWNNANDEDYLHVSRELVRVAHESLGAEPDTRPLVIDPFSGGGAIPLEALRVGAGTFASDTNPVAVLLEKVILEYIPKYGRRLADEVRTWSGWVKSEAEKELGQFYPTDADGATPVAYLWARTIKCEGPTCGASVPLIRSLSLSQKKAFPAVLKICQTKEKHVDFEIVEGENANEVDTKGTVRRGSVTCPVCGFTTKVDRVRAQLRQRRGGTRDARLVCVVTTPPGQKGRSYRLPTRGDVQAASLAATELAKRTDNCSNTSLSLIPDETISLNEIRRISVPLYGMTIWGDLFTARQALTLATFVRLVQEAARRIRTGGTDNDAALSTAVQTLLSLGIDRLADRSSSLCRWDPTPTASGIINTFSRQALPMMWDFAEGVPFENKSGGWLPSLEWISLVVEREATIPVAGHVQCASATTHPLPDDSAHALITDPPYYDAVPYAYLSDFFYVWLRRALHEAHPELFAASQIEKTSEIVVDRPHELSTSRKTVEFYERELAKAFADGRRVLRPDGIGTVVFASKTTSSWEAILKAVVDAGFTITGSWPIDTEMASRVAAQGQARLASSVHLVCRPRENPDGSVRTDAIGDWRDVLTELPGRIHEWLPRLAKEGIVGADAIFACLGPALEVFSRYSRVEKASGEQVTLREYLEHVWAAVAKEALNMIFTGADATGFEEDARLTAMWLWTLFAGAGDRETANEGSDGGSDVDDEDGAPAKKGKVAGGFTLEYDAARKIAQGLGAHLENLTSLVEVKGSNARLLSVAERTKSLFGKEDSGAPTSKARKKKQKQLSLGFADELEEAGESDGWGEKGVPAKAETVLSRIHQSMILFAAGRGEALKRFLVDEGVGSDERFWRLAQALSALYPSGTDEKRWVDGVLARKKNLGF